MKERGDKGCGAYWAGGFIRSLQPHACAAETRGDTEATPAAHERYMGRAACVELGSGPDESLSEWIRIPDQRIKSPSLVRSDFEALTRFGEVTLRGRSNAKSPRRHPTLADEGILS